MGNSPDVGPIVVQCTHNTTLHRCTYNRLLTRNILYVPGDNVVVVTDADLLDDEAAAGASMRVFPLL